MNKLITIIFAAMVSLSAVAGDIVKTNQQSYYQGFDVEIQCTNIPDSTNVYVYQDAARLPLIWYYSNPGNQTVQEATISIPGYTEPWKHVVKAEQGSSKTVIDSTVFFVEETPVLPMPKTNPVIRYG